MEDVTLWTSHNDLLDNNCQNKIYPVKRSPYGMHGLFNWDPTPLRLGNGLAALKPNVSFAFLE
jgi:hypothetical protein